MRILNFGKFLQSAPSDSLVFRLSMFLLYVFLSNSAYAADWGMTVGVFSSSAPYRLDIGTDAMKKNVPFDWNSWATRLKIMHADGTAGTGIVREEDEIGIFSEDGQWRLDIGTDAMKVNTPDSLNSWATRLQIKRLAGGEGPIQYGETIGVFSEDGRWRLDIGNQATKANIPANTQTWATKLNIRRLGSKFAAFGDMPYVKADEDALKNDILPGLAKDKDIQFVIHLGDAGRPGDAKYDACDHYFRKQTIASWSSLLMTKPMFFTPGDNDWTDCNADRVPPPLHYDPILALSDVRYVFYDSPETQNRKSFSGFVQQDYYPENQMWTFKDVQFVSVHMVGSENGWVENDPRRQEEVTSRVAANLAWLNKAFDLAAKHPDISAVVVTFHVDPFEVGLVDKTPWQRCYARTRYRDFCDALRSAALKYKKPVLLIHGDTNQHCMDNPSGSATNLWRLNAPGDFMKADADVVAFDANNKLAPFTVTGLLSGVSPAATCPSKPSL